MPDGGPSDEEIVVRVVAGDVDLYEVLVNRHRDAIFQLLARRLPAAEVPVVAHEVFVSAWESLPRFEPRAPFERWLTRLALRRCHDHWRRVYADARRHDSFDEAACDPADASQSRAARRLEDAELLQVLLGRLSPQDRAVLTLLHLDERPVAEIAEILDWTPDQVKTRAHRARRRLRELAARQAAARNAQP
jgi:RNA polymerase sigma-70 factor (ECF subfamily)